MKRSVLAVATLMYCFVATAGGVPKRPRITQISGVRFYSTHLAEARTFYAEVVRPNGICLWCEEPSSPSGVCLSCEKPSTPPVIIPLSPTHQRLTLSAAPKLAPSNLLYEIVFATDDLKAMKKYLTANKVKFDSSKSISTTTCSVIDPEGHRISFTELPKAVPDSVADPNSLRLIHAGFVVHDRAAEDKFYKDILGFHVYWHGGMKDGEDNWVDMQVPDGADWIEYMLGVSPDASHKTLGVMNHIALGVPDIHAAQQQLIKNGWKGTEEPKIGRDGKWQLNLYDPDETRVELMEFKPTKEPCCSPYTGPHPGPPQ
jgi:catechol 2,3-dioxygenase-like lactoylglutathione lyase family enzyme